MSGSEPVSQREFDLYRQGNDRRQDRFEKATERRLEKLEREVERLAREHDDDMDDLAKAAEEKQKARRGDRQWTLGQVVQVVLAAAAVATLWLAVTAR